jgi:hypothetical protein
VSVGGSESLRFEKISDAEALLYVIRDGLAA